MQCCIFTNASPVKIPNTYKWKGKSITRQCDVAESSPAVLNVWFVYTVKYVNSVKLRLLGNFKSFANVSDSLQIAIYNFQRAPLGFA
jgi:hypothetical protein